MIFRKNNVRLGCAVVAQFFAEGRKIRPPRTPQASAPAIAHGFVGIAFRVLPDDSWYDYVRMGPAKKGMLTIGSVETTRRDTPHFSTMNGFASGTQDLRICK